MTSSLRLGRIAGIEVGLNWSWLIVFALLVWTLEHAVFPSTNPGLSHATYIAMSVAATILFFVSLLLHELGHALQARRERLEIDGITLWLFGGVARIKGGFPSAGTEFRVAIAGPLVSLALGVVFVLLALVGLPSSPDGVVAWLGYINLTLLAFNLLPALPLDGGRVLRSLLWRLWGDLARATRVAVDVGRTFGVLSIAAGIAWLVTRGSFSGAWLAFVGWFLLQAAGSEGRYVLVRESMHGLRAGDLMTPDPATVAPDATLSQLAQLATWRSHAAYPVVEDGRAVGVVPLVHLAEVPRDEWDRHSVREVMLDAAEIPAIAEDEPAVDAVTELGGSHASLALVVADGRLVGVLSHSDLARALDAPAGRRARAALMRRY